MFANHNFHKAIAICLGAMTIMSSGQVQAWQDFQSFEEIMRESELPRGSRVRSAPLRQPESSWPSLRHEAYARPASRGARVDSPFRSRSAAERSEIESSSDTSVRPANRFERRETDPQESVRGDRDWPDRARRADDWPENPSIEDASGLIPLSPSRRSESTSIRSIGQSRFLPPSRLEDGSIDRTYGVGSGRMDRGAGGGSLLPNDWNEREADVTNPSHGELDWRTIRVSVGDLILPGNTVFTHTQSLLSIPEQIAYLDLIQDIKARRESLALDPMLKKESATVRSSVWEESFYKFTRARQLAFENGKLRSESKAARARNDLKDPFHRNSDTRPLDPDTRYSILDDIRRYPDHFTGRPIVLYGIFRGETTRTMDRKSNLLDPTVTSVEEERGEPEVLTSHIYGLQTDSRGQLVKARVLTGTLTSATDGRVLATIDTSGLTTPDAGTRDIQGSWRNQPDIPVMVKGWVIKRFTADRPLIYCESMTLLSPEPHHDRIKSHTYDKERIRKEEKWLYYETLRQLNLTRTGMQQKFARQNTVDRINELQSEIIDKFRDDAKDLKQQFAKNKVSQSEYEQKAVSLQRQYEIRKQRHQKFLTEPELFPTYVDLFNNPEQWHGKLVTLKGHVRHAVTYDADSTMYDGRALHELWLFTENSQQTPTVIVTPELPQDFPVDSDVVNHVSVTGCFFKRYVYRGQTERRIAPLVLAGKIEWTPTVSHVASLVKSGDLSAGSPLAVRAKKLEKMQSGGWISIFIGLTIIFGIMVLWGRAQREERDRLRLRSRVADVKGIENGPAPEFASATDEYLNRV